MEEWKQCDDAPLYEISNKGKVRNSLTGRILKTNIDGRGYERVTLRANGKQFSRKVSRLVGEAFLRDKYRPGLKITNKDGYRYHNDAENLEWKTHREIIRQTYREGREQTHKKKAVRIVETGMVYPSVIECSRATGISKDVISRSLTRRSLKNRCGLTFEYLDY